MRIENPNTDQTVLREIGSRLAHTRLERNLRQADLAAEAGISKATLERLESGRPVQLNNFVRVLRALGQLGELDRLVPEPLPSPIERLEFEGRRRRRASGSRGAEAPAGDSPWSWAEDDQKR